MTTRTTSLVAALTALAVWHGSTIAQASCGCEKPPPPTAVVRPQFAFPAADLLSPPDLTKGGSVALFSESLVAGLPYTVAFQPMQGSRRTVVAIARRRRDMADGAWRMQLWAPIHPQMHLGPAAIEVKDALGRVVLGVPDTDFTVIARPIEVPASGGTVMKDDYRAAVGRDGTVYVALDVTGMLPHVQFAAQGFGLGLRFNKDDMLIYNTQGVLMESLSSWVYDEDLNNDGDSTDPGESDWNGNGLLDNPDISLVVPVTGTDSDAFFYDRHEFENYDVDHQPGGVRAIDPTDPNWHLDGTRHTDNFHFVVAIAAATLNGVSLAPGVTPKFDLVFDAALNPTSGDGSNSGPGNANAAATSTGSAINAVAAAALQSLDGTGQDNGN
jgi:hypothetical protein